MPDHLLQGEILSSGPFFTVCSPYDNGYPFFVVLRDNTNSLFIHGKEPRPYGPLTAAGAAEHCNQLLARIQDIQAAQKGVSWLKQEALQRQIDLLFDEIHGICYLTERETAVQALAQPA